MEMERDESPKQRVNRELAEMLQELRVALPGVQVLFAFLLAIPFQQRFERINATDRRVYFAAVLLAAVSTALLIAPSAHHRVRFRDDVKEQILKWATRFTIAGLATLALSIAATLYLITDVLYGSPTASIVAAVSGASVIAFWLVLPIAYTDDDS